MKKIMILLTVIILSACTETVYVDKATGEKVYPAHTVLVDGEIRYGSDMKLVDIEVDGDHHQYIKYHVYGYDAYTHWESCKYCKGDK